MTKAQRDSTIYRGAFTRESILLGTGTGSFGPKTDFATGNDPRSVSVGDFNRDGKLDLATANESDDTVSILLNNCNFTFDVCLQDDSNGNLLQFNSTTGDYRFTKCGSALVLSGTGTLTTRGSIITLQDYATNRRVLARIDGSVNKGTASIQVFSQGTTFTIMDRNTTNNTCQCSGAH